MNQELTFHLKSICFDENYRPSDSTRITTNFANWLEEGVGNRTCATR